MALKLLSISQCHLFSNNIYVLKIHNLKQCFSTQVESESPAKQFQPIQTHFKFFLKYTYVNSPEGKAGNVYFQRLSSPLSICSPESQGCINSHAFLLYFTYYIVCELYSMD